MSVFNWRLHWFRATHRMIYRDTWYVLFGTDIDDRDYGVTLAWGGWRPSRFHEGWKVWRHEWRINVRWPVSVRRRSDRSAARLTPRIAESGS